MSPIQIGTVTFTDSLIPQTHSMYTYQIMLFSLLLCRDNKVLPPFFCLLITQVFAEELKTLL